MNNILNFFKLGNMRFGTGLVLLLAFAIYQLIEHIPNRPLPIHIILFSFTLILTMLWLNKYKEQLEALRPVLVAGSLLGMYLCLVLAKPHGYFTALTLVIAFWLMKTVRIPPFGFSRKVSRRSFAYITDELVTGVLLGGGYWFVNTNFVD
jgi:hypothetical protein